MATSSFTFYNAFSENLAEAVHNLQAAGHTLRVILSNTVPDLTDTNQASASELTTGGGYTVNGEDVGNDTSRTGATTSVTESLGPIVWTGTPGGFGPFQYVILWNQTADALIGWWDHGTAVSIADTETYTVTFGASLFTIN